MDTVLYTQPPTGTTDELVFTIVDKQGLEASENLSLMFCAQDYLVGSYMLEQTIGSPDPFFGEATKFAEETVTIKASNDGSRIIELTWLGFSSEMVIFADCNSSEILFFEHSGAGAACGTPVIWAPDEENGIVIDDDTFAVRFIDDFENTCGLQESMELTFTRQ